MMNYDDDNTFDYDNINSQGIVDPLNSSPIDELGEGAYEGGWWSQAKCEHRARHAGIQGNPESGNHHQAPSH